MYSQNYASDIFAPQPQALSLSQFTQIIGNTIRANKILNGAWVCAELSDVRSSGGHCYMELIEKAENGQTISRLRANIWQSTFVRLRRKFYDTTGSDIISGLKVMVFGAATHHNLYGLAFNITDIDPNYTLGDMQRIRREILATLTKEGIINANKEKVIPLAPQKIAVISAGGAAGYGDFINHLSANTEGFAFYPVLFQAVMQGEKTAESVMAALDKIESNSDKWDYVVIIRGGGSTSDLAGFDDLQLARRVALSPIPVVVGIGHERDRTVLDEIACIRCKTPTAVANFLVDSMRQALATTENLASQIVTYARERLSGEQLRLTNIAGIIPSIAMRCLSEASSRLSTLTANIPNIAGLKIVNEHSRLHSISTSIENAVNIKTVNAHHHLEFLSEALLNNVENNIATENKRLEHLDEMIKVLSPENTLKRGYSITRINGHSIKNAAELNTDDVIETIFSTGKISSVVK